MAEDQTKNAKDTTPKNGSFDPTSTEETLKWLAIENDRITNHKTDGNAFANKTQAQIEKEVCEFPIGKQINWLMVVTGVDEKGWVSVCEPSIPEKYPENREEAVNRIRVFLHLPGRSRNDDLSFPWDGDLDSLRKLRPGSRVRLIGTIRATYREIGIYIIVPNKKFRSEISWRFRFDDAKLKPE